MIGLDCPTGDVDDCNENLPNDHVPDDCEGVLIFTDNTQDGYTCGANCNDDLRRNNQMTECEAHKTCGWTKYIRCVQDNTSTIPFWADNDLKLVKYSHLIH